MKHTLKTTLTILAALSLTACGGDSKSEMDHSKMGKDKMMGDTGHTTGVVISISPDGSVATINHKEIEGVGMGAMTMGFGITSTVDLSGYAKDDNVNFMVKKGRDGSYRITAICNTDTDGNDCLDATMEHNRH